MATATDTADSRRALGLEALALALIMSLGVGLRFAYPERMAVEHFDEGVYAVNWFCLPPGLPEGTYPRQYLYAPPLLPGLCYWTLFAAGGNPHAVMWINVVAGSLMIPLVWWVARGWFGPAAGLMAAALCACSDVHVGFSRMVLTDVMLCLFLTAGVGLGVKAIQTGRPGTIALAGVLAGLAWWTKYNGWLTLAITGAGLAGWLVFGRPRGVSWTALILRWLATAVIAFAVWSPVLWSLQSVGGYAAVAENHARYFVGVAGWWDSARSQLHQLGHLDSRLGIILAVLSVAAASAVARRSTALTVMWMNAAAYGLCLGAVIALLSLTWRSTMAAFTVFGVVELVRNVRDRRRFAATSSATADPSELCSWTALAWLLGLFVSVPLYTPYPRLALPLVCGSWLGLAVLADPRSAHHCAAASICKPNHKPISGAITFSAMIPVAIVVVALAGWLLWSRPLPTPLPEIAWQDRRGLSSLAEPIAEFAAVDFAASPAPGVGGVQAALYVYAEPALFYHLSARQIHPNGFQYLVQPIGDHTLLEQGPPDSALATYVVTGLHADAVASDRQAFAAAVADGRLTLVREWDYQPSELVSLDHAAGAMADAARVRLFRVRVNK